MGQVEVDGTSFWLPMSFLLSTFLDWKVTLEPIAAPKPAQLKDASVKDARLTPATIGSRLRTTLSSGFVPRKTAESSTEKKGSSDCTREESERGQKRWRECTKESVRRRPRWTIHISIAPWGIYIYLYVRTLSIAPRPFNQTIERFM